MEVKSQRKQSASVVPAKPKRYRLLAGMHIEQVVIPNATGEDGVPLCEERIYYPGDIVETVHDMLAYNAPGKPPKFAFADAPGATVLGVDARVWDSAKEPLDAFVARMRTEAGDNRPAAKPDLSRMSEKELRAYAADNEIDVSRAKGHAETLKAIQAAAS